jgi:hypothetical protein
MSRHRQADQPAPPAVLCKTAQGLDPQQQDPASGSRHQLAAAVTLAVVLLATWAAYSPGLTGPLHFDDPHNLGGLSQVQDVSSALAYCLSGAAGPLGRPITLCSFAAQAYAWPGHTEILLRTNVLIHLINGCLVAWALLLVSLARGLPMRSSAYLAVAASGIWLALPLLASSSLFIVQRMTTLSALFVLVGIVAYLYARRLACERPIAALIWMTASLVVGAALATLSKENGALLPLFILSIELTLLRRPETLRPVLWNSWKAIVLLGPALALTVYLVMRSVYSDGTVAVRGFTGLERLLTQPMILWLYVQQAFAPFPAHLGPFQDDHGTLTTALHPWVLLPALAWVVLGALAYRWRRCTPLPAFAALWFLIGHSLESTSLPLELYFEHRNYLPLIGPVYALVCGLLALARRWPTLAAAALGCYWLVLIATLWSFTSLWGSPWLAAEMWHIHRPESVRAAQHLAGQLQRNGDTATSLRVLERTYERHPHRSGVAAQVLAVSCALDPERDHSAEVLRLQAQLTTAPFGHGVLETIAMLRTATRETPCMGVSDDRLYALANAMIENPGFRAHPRVYHNAHAFMAEIGIDRRDLALTMDHLESALDAYPNPLTLRLAVATLISAGLHDEARAILARAQDWQPRTPFQAVVWDQQLQRTLRLLDASTEEK